MTDITIKEVEKLVDFKLSALRNELLSSTTDEYQISMLSTSADNTQIINKINEIINFINKTLRRDRV
jgi:hypothetical protein